MKLDRYTEKAQEAILAAQRTAEELQSPVLDAEHLLHALVEPDDGVPAETLRRHRRRPARRSAASWPGSSSRRAKIQGGSMAPRPAGEARRWSWPSRRPGGSATSTSRPSTCSSAVIEVGGEGRELLERHGATREAILSALQSVRGGQRVTSPNPGGHVRGAREVRPRPDRRGPRRQARPGHRPRRGDPAGHPGPAAGGRRTTRS